MKKSLKIIILLLITVFELNAQDIKSSNGVFIISNNLKQTKFVLLNQLT